MPLAATDRMCSWLPSAKLPVGLVDWPMAYRVWPSGDRAIWKTLVWSVPGGEPGGACGPPRRELLDLHRMQRVGQREDADRVRPGVAGVEEMAVGADGGPARPSSLDGRSRRRR